MEHDAAELSSIVSRALRPLDDSRTEDYYKYIVLLHDGIVSYNDRICVYSKYRTGVDCVVPAKQFYKALPKRGTVELALESDANVLTITTEKTRAEISTVDASELISSLESIKIKKKRKWKRMPVDLIPSFQMTYQSASKEMNEPAMTCVHIDNDRVVATDEIKVTECVMRESTGLNLLLPAKTVAELVSYEGTFTHYCVEMPWIFFNTLDADSPNKKKFCARIITAEFPDYQHLFEFTHRATFTIPVDETLEAVRYIAPLAVEDEHGFTRMKCTFIKNKGEYKTEDPGIGVATADVELERPVKKKVSFIVNPGMFISVLRRSNRVLVGEDRLLFKSNTPPRFTHLIALFKEDE